MKISDQSMWMCPNCREAIEAQFQRCWNCGSDDRGNLDPSFVNDAEPEPTPQNGQPLVVHLAWMVLAVASFVVVMAFAIFVDRNLPEWWNRRLSLSLILLVICLVSAVSINVASRLYMWLRQYLSEPDATTALVQLKDARKQNDN